MKKVGKILLVCVCIVTLLMPFCTEVLAGTITSSTESTYLRTVSDRQGGAESSGLATTTVDGGDYNEFKYAYTIAGKDVLKIIQNNGDGETILDSDYDSMFYCINALGSMPEATVNKFLYTNQGDFTNSSNSAVQAWKDRIGISDNDYQSLIKLLNVIYLMKEDTSYKEEFIKNAFADELASNAIPQNTVGSIAATITDDDIDVIQQWAIWYFTNKSTGYTSNEDTDKYHNSVYDTLGSIQIANLSGTYDMTSDSSEFNARYQLMVSLYNYLISGDYDVTTSSVTYPSIASGTVSSSVDGDYYKVGIYKINSGTYAPSDFTASFKFYDASGNEMSNVNYTLKDANGNTVNSMAYDTDYYVYVPVSGNTVSTVELSISYTTRGGRQITIWTGEDESGQYEHMQDLVLVTEEPGEPKEEVKQGNITDVDLALRKYVLSVNGISSGRTIDVDTTKLANGSSTTAEYHASKDPIKVKAGDSIVYQFNIYNEGSVDATVGTVVDYIPEGLSLAENSTTNSKYGWVQGETYSNGFTEISTDYLKNTVINAFDGTNLSYTWVQVELIIEDTATGTVLTNVSEIISSDGNDRDSVPRTIDPETLTNDYTGNTSNKSDLSDDDYYYKGLEDDDDFEKVMIDGFDFALKKFITTVNETSYDREPVVNTEPLKNGSNDADYSVDKSVVNVKTGDIVTFTLRVYNEGDLAGYAEEITEYIPEGLGFLVNYQTNYDNCWALSEGADSVELGTITNGTENVTADDFIDGGELELEPVVLGQTKVTTNALNYSVGSTSNLISGFDGGDTLDYRDVQITCIVTTEDEITLKNIAAITEEKDENGEDVPHDRDSSPIDDIDPDSYGTGNEDDDDYDVIKTTGEDFDLALQKFITGLNDEEVTSRVPVPNVDANGNITYTQTKDPLYVGNGDLVTYTIRVYNEGDVNGFASEIIDDIPVGLVYVTDNETNQAYGWEMIDSSGEVTTDVNQAVKVRTSYLADTLLKAFDEQTLSYADVQIVFQVDESAIEATVDTEARTLINTAEISEARDENGELVPDIDSTPNNNVIGEDDLDQEQVYVKYFDLALSKDLQSAIVTVDGQSNTYNVADGEDSIKVEVNRKKVSTTTIQFVFNVTVTNEGEIAGYATEITDYIPDGLYFVAEDNPDWVQTSEKVITTDALAKTLLQPGETATVPVILRWEQSSENTGKFINIAEISEDWNEYGSPDIDSTPNNLNPNEDDYDTAPVYVSISTGLADQPYIILTTGVLLIIGTGVALIKKFVF